MSVQQKPIDEVTDCEQRPSCALSFRELNALRESTYRIMRSWVPRWLWPLVTRLPVVRTLLTKKVDGDLTPAGMEKRRQTPEKSASKFITIEKLPTWLVGGEEE